MDVEVRHDLHEHVIADIRTEAYFHRLNKHPHLLALKTFN